MKGKYFHSFGVVSTLTCRPIDIIIESKDRFANWVTTRVVPLPERAEIGGPKYRIGPDDCLGRA